MRVLVVNTGSSSLKLSFLVPGDPGATTVTETVDRWDGEQDLAPLERFLARVGEPDAVGHRVVHGGPRHPASVLLDERVLADLDEVADLAPLHNPRAVAAARAVTALLPDRPTVAAFDTSFHADMPAAARTYALPKEWNDRWSLRRYGFHGLSHAYAVRRAAGLVGRPLETLRVVSCHLGSGASLAAVRNGRAVDTSMGFSPLSGLVMATRPGSVDPGLVLWLQEHGRVPLAELASALETRSGLRGLSGTSGDLRDVLQAVEAGQPDAVLAWDVYVHRLRREIGAMAASLGGLDLLVMTGGVGEHLPVVRAAAAEGTEHLGVRLDPRRNEAARADADISAEDAGVRTVVVTAREDVEVAREVERVLRVGRPDRGP